MMARAVVKLNAGKNTLTIANTKGTPAVVDQISYEPAGTPPEKFRVSVRKSEHGTASADKASAAEGESVVLKATPSSGYGFSGWDVVHGDVKIGKDGRFTMPDDIVTVRPVSKCSARVISTRCRM